MNIFNLRYTLPYFIKFVYEFQSHCTFVGYPKLTNLIHRNIKYLNLVVIKFFSCSVKQLNLNFYSHFHACNLTATHSKFWQLCTNNVLDTWFVYFRRVLGQCPCPLLFVNIGPHVSYSQIMLAQRVYKWSSPRFFLHESAAYLLQVWPTLSRASQFSPKVPALSCMSKDMAYQFRVHGDRFPSPG